MKNECVRFMDAKTCIVAETSKLSNLAQFGFLLLATCGLVFGQGLSSGSVTGIVTDSTKAIVPGAEVILTDEATGRVTRYSSNKDGVFNFPSVPIGTYQLHVSKSGFRAYVEEHILVETARAARIDVALQVGATQDTVTVTAEVPLLASETSDIGTQGTHDMIVSLPFQVSGLRNPWAFLRLTPGGDSTQGNSNDGYRIAGGKTWATEAYVDGAPTSYNPWQNAADVTTPAMEIVSEVRVETAVPNAEYGRSMSGTLLITTKSGTNAPHGGIFSLFRNSALAARTFNTAAVSPLRQAELGGTLGGPILIPNVYDGRNRTFFFVNYTGSRQFSQPLGQTGTVATAQQKAGDFSQTGQIVYDPTTADANGQRQPFPGNSIPTGRMSPLALKLQSFFPAPNARGIASNFIGGLPAHTDVNLVSAKIDHQFSEQNRVSGSYRQRVDERLYYNGFLLPISDHVNQGVTVRTATLTDDWIIKPNLLNRLQLNLTRFSTPITNSESIGLQVPGAFAAGFPNIRFNSQGFNGLGYDNDRLDINTNIDYQDTVSWTTGTHNAKFGARFAQYQTSQRAPGNLAGQYNFSQFETSQPQVPGTGNSYASFLLGLVDGASMSTNTPWTMLSHYFGVFAQDTWKVSAKLTINYGYRWESQVPFYEMNGTYSEMNPSVPNPGAGNISGAVVFAGTGPGRSGLKNFVPTYHGAHAPRMGAAYRLARNTVVRAGAGLFYAPLFNFNWSRTGWVANNSAISSGGGLLPAFQLDQGWPAALVTRPPFIDPSVSNRQGTVTYQSGSARLGRTAQWQFSIQHTIRNVLVEADYVATVAHGINNNALVNLNQLPPQDLTLGALLTRSITDPLVVAAGYKLPYPGFSGTLAQARRPFPQYTGITTYATPTGNSTYHALYVKSEKRLSNGLQYLISYQLSKELSDVTMSQPDLAAPQDQYNRRAEKALANTDYPQRLITSLSYELPMGKGKPFAQHGTWAQVLGGWSVSGILTYQAGGPLAVTNPNSLPIFNGQLRPNLVPGVPIMVSPGRGSFQPLNALTGQTGDFYLNRAAFSTPAPFTFGNLGPFLPNVRAPGIRNEDFSIMRRIRLQETWRAELRGDFFNAFNHRNLNAPITDLSNPSFGRITGQSGARTIQIGFRVDF